MRGLIQSFVLLGVFLVACTTDAGYNPSESYKDRSVDYIVDNLDRYSSESYLPKCTDTLDKKVFFVSSALAAYVCLEGEWARIRNIERNSPEIEGIPYYDPKSKDVSGLVSEGDYKLGSITDPRDGHTYRTVTFNGLEWMAENLDFHAEGDVVSSDCSSLLGAKNCRFYSQVYGYYDESLGDYPRNLDTLCPLDFKVPTMLQWDTLFSSVGYWTSAGKSLKSRDFVGEKNRRGDDIISFSILPAGYHSGNYGQLGKNAGFASLDDEAVIFSADEDRVRSSSILSGCYFSVRCVRRAR